MGRFHVSSTRKVLCTLATKNLVLQKSCMLLGQDTAESACVTKSTERSREREIRSPLVSLQRPPLTLCQLTTEKYKQFNVFVTGHAMEVDFVCKGNKLIAWDLVITYLLLVLLNL